ncbi:MAG: Flp pilus assembly protein CpaB [Alphaproteobacteria bacterium]|jgi:pilus assembly protein CpaB|nr:Flp pilus assembly protein CpaB [Alphaproteobacteria bacterium]
MRAIFALVLIAGVGLAGFAVYMAQGFIENMRAEVARLEAEKARMPEMTRIAVVTEPMAYGEALNPDAVKLIGWQADSVPEGAFKDLEELFPEGEGDRFIVRRFEAFEPVIQAKVTKPGEEAGITSRLSKGMRAFAIRVDVTSGVSGFLRPGDRVDIYWTGRGGEESSLSREITKLIESRVKIVAVDQIADTDRTAPVVARTVTVEATPQQVASLAQAQSTGRLSLSLVGAEDETISDVVSVNQNDLLGIVEKEPEIVEKEEVCTTKVRRGADVIVQEIPCTN